MRWIGNQLSQFRASDYWRDIAWLSSGSLLAHVLTLVVMPIASRLYTPDDFGVASIFTVIVGFVSVIVTCRYEYFVQLPKHKVNAWRLVRLVVLFGCVNCAVLTPAAWLWRETLAGWTGNSALAPWLVAVPAGAVAISISTALQGWTQRQRRYRRSAESNVLSKCGYFGSILAGYWLIPGGGGLILAGTASALAKVAYLARGSHFSLLLSRRGVSLAAREQAELAGALILSHIFMAITAAIPTLFISRTYGSDVLGQFALAYQTVLLPSSLVGSAIGNVYYQRAAETWARGDSIARLWRSSASRLLMIGMPVYAIAAALSPSLFPVIFGSQWRLAGHYAGVLSICAFFSFVTGPLGWTFAVVGMAFYLPLWHAARLVTTLIVAFCARYFGLGAMFFILLIVAQTSLLYLADYYAEWRFSLRPSPNNRNNHIQNM